MAGVADGMMMVAVADGMVMGPVCSARCLLAAVCCSHIWMTRGRVELTAGCSLSFLATVGSASSLSLSPLSGESLDGLNARHRNADGFFR